MSKTNPPRGSLRCILGLVQATDFLLKINGLLTNTGTVISSNDIWFPKGYHQPAEKELHEFLDLIGETNLSEEVERWWLAVHTSKTKTPNWDLISTIKTSEGKNGILLVEAKAHHGEIGSSGKPLAIKTSENSEKNYQKIRSAIEEANADISLQVASSNISILSCYQLSNRVAHAWWLANKGYHVVLMYLGFQECKDMPGRKLFLQDADWPICFDKKMSQVGLRGMVNKKYQFGQGSLQIICTQLKDI
jgi:hypothetical protein